MQPTQDQLGQIKQKMRDTWMAGDFGQIAQFSRKEAEDFVNRIPGVSGRVLDVACGTGNLAIPAARRGAQVTGVDIAPNLLEQARNRASEEGLDITFDEGDAEQLPYPDAQFDVVMTMFGAMFAPRPEKAASELMRVCRHGGLIAMANWTPEGFVGKMFGLGSLYVPPPPGLLPPVLWGDENTVRARFGAGVSSIDTERRIIAFDYPHPPSEVVSFFRQYFGPTKVAFSRLDEEHQKAFAADLENLWSKHNEADAGRTLVRAEYLQVTAVRA